MALTSKEKLNHQARKFKDKLEALACPYTEGVDESWVIDLLFKPGEHRIRLLLWLFTKFDSRLDDVLDPQFCNSDTKMDSRIQRLLYVAHSLGLCGQDDVDIIRGCGSVSKQVAFMEHLLDLVYIMERSEDPQARSMKSPGIISEGMSLKEQFYSDCWFVDSLADQERLDTVLMSDAKLLPPDITRQLDIQPGEQAGDTSELPQPDLSSLQETARELTKDLKRQQEILDQLKQAHEFAQDDPQSVENVEKTLRLVLSELSQLLVGFSYCFENEMRQWCNKTPPELTELGRSFKRIHGLLDYFVEMSQSVGSIRSSHKVMSLHLPARVQTLATSITKVTDGRTVMADMQDYIGILEDSLARVDASSSRTSLNSSVLSNVVKLK